jgi:copper oxidase (laccase) domain-containing protein
LESDGSYLGVHWRVSERRHGDFHPERVPEFVLRERQQRLVSAPWTLARQVHGVQFTEVLSPGAANLSRSDILATSVGGAVLGVWVADCVPLLLIAPSGRFVVAHVGWRGLAAGVISSAVDQLCRDQSSRDQSSRDQSGSLPKVGDRHEDVVAVIGPFIGPCCYEFSFSDARKVADALRLDIGDICPPSDRFPTALDMGAAVSGCLQREGIADVRWAPGPDSSCTGCDERWFSHRVRKEVERHVMVGWRQI